VIYPPTVDRQSPRSTNDEIDLYIRTYYSLLRSSGDVRRARLFEEAHLSSKLEPSPRGTGPQPPTSRRSPTRRRGSPTACPGSAGSCWGRARSSSHRPAIRSTGWQTVRQPAVERRPLRWDGGETLAVFIASASDIDDLVPIVHGLPDRVEQGSARRLLAARLTEVGDDRRDRERDRR